MAVFRAHTDSLINHYGWVDRPAGIARIPIDSAIAIVSRQGLDMVRGAAQRQPMQQEAGGDTSRTTTPLPQAPSEVKPEGSALEKR
jgi:hypothetical protein